MVKTLAVLCACCLVPGIAQANSLTNASFETPLVPVGNFSLFSPGSAAIPGWSVTGAAGTNVGIVSTTFVQNGVAFEAQNGSQWVDLTGLNSNTTEGLAQTAATTPGTAYTLTFYVGNTTGGGIFGTTSTVGLDINGLLVNSFTNSNGDATGLNWQQFTYNFTASGASTVIGFVNLDPASDNSNGLDMVDLELGTSAVPEPSSVALLGLAFAAMVLLRTRAKRPRC
jgi:Protein of unknown function (DUF642)/PEP-CTERM motif